MTTLSLRFCHRPSARRRVSAAELRPSASRPPETAVRHLAARQGRRRQTSWPTRGIEGCVAGGTPGAVRRIRRAAHPIGDTAHRVLYAAHRIRVAAQHVPVAAGLVRAAAYHKHDAALPTAVATRHLFDATCRKARAICHIRATAGRTPAATRRPTRHHTPPTKSSGRLAIPHLPHPAADSPPPAGMPPPRASDCPPLPKFLRPSKNHGRERLRVPPLLPRLLPYRTAIAPRPAIRRQAGPLSAAAHHQRDERPADDAAVAGITARRAKLVIRRQHP